MRRQITAFFAALAISTFLVPAASAEDLDTSSHPDTVLHALSPYSLGIGIGALAAGNRELVDESEAFLKLSLVQSVHFRRFFEAGLDLNWLAPGNNWSGEATLSFMFGQAAFRPFIGGGAGIGYFDKEGQDFGQGLGVSATAHAGLMLDVMDEVQVRLRVPYTMVTNKDQDRTVGMDLAVLFGTSLHNKRVKKLIY